MSPGEIVPRLLRLLFAKAEQFEKRGTEFLTGFPTKPTQTVLDVLEDSDSDSGDEPCG